MHKTFKREVSGALLLALAGAFIWGHLADSGSIIDSAKYLTTPVFLFASGAFGLDAIAKQFGGRG